MEFKWEKNRDGESGKRGRDGEGGKKNQTDCERLGMDSAKWLKRNSKEKEKIR